MSYFLLALPPGTPQDNAYLACRPPDNPGTQRKERPPLQEYIRHLIFTVLNKVCRDKALTTPPAPWAPPHSN